jgi:hypothetical protein
MCLSLSLSLSHTHTHTLSLSLSHTHTHTHFFQHTHPSGHTFSDSLLTCWIWSFPNLYPCRSLHPWIGRKLLSTNAWCLHKGIGSKS